MRTGILIATAALACAACSSETPSTMRGNAARQECITGNTQACPCASGSGMQTCSPANTWNACQCAAPIDAGGIGNPDPVTPTVDSGMVMQPRPAGDCSPGLYLGTYECEISLFGLPVPLAGDVSFNLSINESTVDGECEPGTEFCSDLVISENGGTLFGFAGLVGFETMLEGALDCTTGEFRASGIGGRYGNAISTDPNDPNALWTVEDPPYGMFEGELTGTHEKASSETIAGSWNLREVAMDITCAGPFTVTLQP